MSDGRKRCFVICPIGGSRSKVRGRSDKVLRHIIEPAAKECGYADVVRADRMPEPGVITPQVIERLIEDEMVVADLTDRNANVFYELAVRHAVRKPYVQIIQRGEQLPFDLAGARTIEVDHRDLDRAEEARREIVKQMLWMQGAAADGREIYSPIALGIDVLMLRRGNPDQQHLADVLAGLAEVKQEVGVVEYRLKRMLVAQAGRLQVGLLRSSYRLEKRYQLGDATAIGIAYHLVRMLTKPGRNSLEGAELKEAGNLARALRDGLKSLVDEAEDALNPPLSGSGAPKAE